MKRKNKKIKYQPAPDLDEKAKQIASVLFPHVKTDFISCIRSFNSKSRGTIARCHALGKVMQLGMGVPAFYAIEFLSERFDKLPETEQEKIIIHELMHIPKTFGGGFKHHDFVTDKNINMMYERYLRCRDGNKI